MKARAIRVLGGIFRELVGLFVDDGILALAILVWLAVCGLGLPLLGLGAEARAILLILGLAAMLVENTLRAARRRNR